MWNIEYSTSPTATMRMWIATIIECFMRLDVLIIHKQQLNSLYFEISWFMHCGKLLQLGIKRRTQLTRQAISGIQDIRISYRCGRRDGSVGKGPSWEAASRLAQVVLGRHTWTVHIHTYTKVNKMQFLKKYRAYHEVYEEPPKDYEHDRNPSVSLLERS